MLQYSTPYGSIILTSGVLQIVKLQGQMEYSICTKISAIWSTPNGNSGVHLITCSQWEISFRQITPEVRNTSRFICFLCCECVTTPTCKSFSSLFALTPPIPPHSIITRKKFLVTEEMSGDQQVHLRLPNQNIFCGKVLLHFPPDFCSLRGKLFSTFSISLLLQQNLRTIHPVEICLLTFATLALFQNNFSLSLPPPHHNLEHLQQENTSISSPELMFAHLYLSSSESTPKF